MIWLAWRQTRSQVLVVAGVLVVLGVLLAISGAHLLHLYDTDVATCGQHNDCASVMPNFETRAKWTHVWDILVIITPALIGMFWGAPLVARELETRTNRLAWTQSVTRTRWFTTRAAVVSVAGAVTAGLVSLMVTWWSSPYDRLRDDPFNVFDQRDVVPVAYALFALALGISLGVVIRRTLPAMAATLAAFVAVRLAVSQWVRPRLFSPLRLVTPFVGPPDPGTVAASVNDPGLRGINQADLIVSQQTLNRAGRVIGQNGGIGPNGNIGFHSLANGSVTFQGVGRCPNTFPAVPSNRQVTPALNEAVQRCIASFHLRTLVTYQPADRYWPLQWAEVAIFTVLAVLLFSGAFWWVRRKLS